MNTETQEQTGVFEGISDMDAQQHDLSDLMKYNDEPENSEGETKKAPDGEASKGKDSNKQPDFKRLDETNKNLQEQNRQLIEDMKKLKEKVSVTDKIQQAFSDDKSERDSEARKLAEQAALEEDPYGFIVGQLNARDKRIEDTFNKKLNEAVTPIRGQLVVDECRRDIEGKYDINLRDADIQRKVSQKLNEVVSPEYQAKYPKKALLLASHLAGVLKQRDMAGEPGTYNTPDGSSYYGTPDASEQERKAVMDSIRRADVGPVFK